MAEDRFLTVKKGNTFQFFLLEKQSNAQHKLKINFNNKTYYISLSNIKPSNESFLRVKIDNKVLTAETKNFAYNIGTINKTKKPKIFVPTIIGKEIHKVDLFIYKDYNNFTCYTFNIQSKLVQIEYKILSNNVAQFYIKTERIEKTYTYNNTQFIGTIVYVYRETNNLSNLIELP